MGVIIKSINTTSVGWYPFLQVDKSWFSSRLTYLHQSALCDFSNNGMVMDSTCSWNVYLFWPFSYSSSHTCSWNVYLFWPFSYSTSHTCTFLKLFLKSLWRFTVCFLFRAVKKYSQAAVNRKRKFEQMAAPSELKLYDFISKKKEKKITKHGKTVCDVFVCDYGKSGTLSALPKHDNPEYTTLSPLKKDTHKITSTTQN